MKAPIAPVAVAALTPEMANLTDPEGPDAMLALLRLLYRTGRGDLPLGRLFEGHVDALQIISRYGSSAQAEAAAVAARAGGLFGVWNADDPCDPLSQQGARLSGGKLFASGAGLLSHALVTVDRDGGRQLALLDLVQVPPEIDRSWWQVTGMQRSETHVVRWAGSAIDPDAWIGVPGEHLREPWLSGGALRFAAVQAGGVASVVDQVRTHLVAEHRASDSYQKDRLAALYLAAQSAAAAVVQAARKWSVADVPATLAHVAAARAATYSAAEQAIALAQAAVGVKAMFVSHQLAETLNDLSVYIRQPGPDAQRAKLGEAVAAGLLTPSL